MRKLLQFMFSAMLVFCTAGSHAEVTDAASNGFSVRYSVEVAGTREDVYRAAIDNVGEWWSDDHTFSGDASRMFIDPRPLGCFCETLGDGGGVVHLVVTFVNPGVMLRLSGGLGPLGLMGVNGNMTWEFADSGAGTTVTLHYAVGGYVEGGLDPLAPAVDEVLVGQMERLKAFVEEQDQGPD